MYARACVQCSLETETSEGDCLLSPSLFHTHTKTHTHTQTHVITNVRASKQFTPFACRGKSSPYPPPPLSQFLPPSPPSPTHTIFFLHAFDNLNNILIVKNMGEANRLRHVFDTGTPDESMLKFLDKIFVD